MAKKATTTETNQSPAPESKRQATKFKSKQFTDGTVQTDTYTTRPRTVITLEGNIPKSVTSKILSAIDDVLAEGGL